MTPLFKHQYMKTYQPKHKDIKRNWHLLDADGKPLGRLATHVATFLMGKHKPSFSKHMDMGDIVVVVNAAKVKLTGKKLLQKVYYSHSGYPGGFKETKVSKLMTERPEKVIEKAVYGMLPDNRLRSDRMKRLRIYKGDKHPHGNMFGKESSS